ncbi:DUF302 domain-containing protein [Blastococcus tunisiensis]|uniref:Uncharacterized conserved protein, DUF302 family n=1 Tax=Blastococcus tunisiensis TaxID=1798228 RepID=A0A1I2IRH6_9ACTN|nr:DUF302 domain-containing protein [Blastococcus sp. DSM 46838]SFF43416.1 Uncharacterized conserved protein, DUF302 family [Blastococcus sp. DSM 46838]
MEYRRTLDLAVPFAEAVTRTKDALAEQGFGILTEIDVQATLRQKRGVEMEPYLILGACAPDLAQQALEVDRGIGVLLPCNVVVSQAGSGSTVQVLDPQTMVSMTERPELQPMADEAGRRLDAALAALGS